MIPYNAVTAWGVSHPWPTREQIEQDMLLSKAICDIYNNDALSGELVLRGGTALNKLILKEPYRYSTTALVEIRGELSDKNGVNFSRRVG